MNDVTGDQTIPTESTARGTSGTDAPSDHPEPADRQRVKHGGPLSTAVVVNPARVDDLHELRATIEETLAGAGWPAPLWLETTPEDPGAGQARYAVAEGAEVVFVSGGDGTVRSCVEGVAGTEAALAVLPAGTGNLLAANLGLPDDPTEGVRLAVERGRHLLDIGEVDGQSFAVMAGMGFDAKLLEDASTTLKARIGSPAYLLAAIKHLRDPSMRLEIRVDDHPPLRRRARTVIIGNVGRLQGGVRLLADAEPDNGQLDVAILAPRRLTHWIVLAWGILRRHEHVPRMEVLRGSRITVASDRVQPCELDGDVIEPRRTLSVTVRPAALWLCVYQPDRSPDLAKGSPKQR